VHPKDAFAKIRGERRKEKGERRKKRKINHRGTENTESKAKAERRKC
jgi:hypothetical protein